MISSEKKQFKDFLEVEERSAHTIRQYMNILDWFEDFLIKNNTNLSELTEYHIIKFQQYLKQKSLTDEYYRKYKKIPNEEELDDFSKKEAAILNGKSIYKYLTTIRKFLEVNEKQLNWIRIPTPKLQDNFKPKVLSKENIKEIANVAERYCSFKHKAITFTDCESCSKYRKPKNKHSAQQRIYPDICFYFDGLKLKTMIQLAYEAALRTDELCSLKLRHISLQKKEVFIEKPLKHSQPQAIPISDELTKILKIYLEKNKSIKNTDDILFPSKMRKKYHANNFATHVFRPIAKEAGFDVRYYSLRHSRATNLLKDGLDVEWVRRITRHKNINNVLKYIHLTSLDIRKELEKKKIM